MGGTKRPSATPDQLWANFRDKLNNNNYAKLQGRPLTDTEFNQVKRAIEVRMPYEVAKLLAAENGIGKVEVERDNAKLGTVTLELLWKADVAGGKSSYEVVRQVVQPRLAGTQDIDPDRRFVHQRKLEKLKELKNGYLQKGFC